MKVDEYALFTRSLVPADAADALDADSVLIGALADWGAADIVCEMVSVAEEQSATVLSLLVGYLSPICVAVLARALSRPVSMCAFVCRCSKW
jgi:hypothetical protein